MAICMHAHEIEVEKIYNIFKLGDLSAPYFKLFYFLVLKISVK